ncbi:hypothetical protein PFLUV_G00064790 [Perca fluviatilis]|uniref:PDZ domain-containing protein n=1 Tax=Perca fluviatilis TaxID=8168 RepID=A0A6A5FND0_PERFL|nr:hypothetical protein PFLUV_G00064790 [Perca fluviatilis]
MGCNMCVVKRPEDQYRIMFQQKGRSDSLRPMDRHGNIKVRGRRPSQLPLDRPQISQQPLQQLGSSRRSHRRKGTLACSTIANGNGSVCSVAMVAIPDCVDNATQTDISFQNTRGHHYGDRGGSPPALPSPPPGEMDAINQFCVFEFNDPDDYFDVSNHEVDRQDALQYEEVSLYKSSQREKLGLTVCYRTDDEDDLGIYVGEVNPNSVAAKNGRIREGDRILQRFNPLNFNEPVASPRDKL